MLATSGDCPLSRQRRTSMPTVRSLSERVAGRHKRISEAALACTLVAQEHYLDKVAWRFALG